MHRPAVIVLAIVALGSLAVLGIVVESNQTRAPKSASPRTASTTSSQTQASPSAPPARRDRAYRLHTDIVATTFWVGEIFNAHISDGSQVCSTYDSNWAYHWSGRKLGIVPDSDPGCPGAAWGGCDGVSTGVTWQTFKCDTEARTAANDYFPSQVTPLENPFYLDVPFDDVNDQTAFAERCQVVPWANDPGYKGNCTNPGFSYMKNRWVQITGPNGETCYGQVEDAGPSHDDLYHDAAYVFGTTNARPIQGQFNNAGADVSPALNGCLGFSELDGDSDHIAWRFVNSAEVPKGPWTKVTTDSGVAS